MKDGFLTFISGAGGAVWHNSTILRKGVEIPKRSGCQYWQGLHKISFEQLRPVFMDQDLAYNEDRSPVNYLGRLRRDKRGVVSQNRIAKA
jgi:hypothetical protein